MPNPKARAAALMASPEDAEAQFYEALRDGDLERLMAVWADDEEIVCVHPGGTRITGVHAIRASFEAIFANGTLAVHPEHVQALHAMGCAVHSVLERLDLDRVRFIGYAFQIEMKYRAYVRKFNILEVPIIFTDRTRGQSKMSNAIIKEAVFGVITLRLRHIFKKL